MADSNFRLQGSWKTATAGGCFNHPSWRFNQQYSLRLDATATDFKLELAQTGTSYNIGVYLLKDTKDTLLPIYHDAGEKMLHKSGFKSKSVGTCNHQNFENRLIWVFAATSLLSLQATSSRSAIGCKCYTVPHLRFKRSLKGKLTTKLTTIFRICLSQIFASSSHH